MTTLRTSHAIASFIMLECVHKMQGFLVRPIFLQTSQSSQVNSLSGLSLVHQIDGALITILIDHFVHQG